MAKFKGAIVIDIEKCKGCGLCVEVCPQDVIVLGNNVNAKGYFYADIINEDCTACESVPELQILVSQRVSFGDIEFCVPCSLLKIMLISLE
jgi:2-oxoglutarate ferredoxin oxidoreductase subunit delta